MHSIIVQEVGFVNNMLKKSVALHCPFCQLWRMKSLSTHYKTGEAIGYSGGTNIAITDGCAA